MEKRRLNYLFEQYYRGAASAAEKKAFLMLIARGEHSREIEALLLEEIRHEKGEFNLTPEEVEAIKKRVYEIPDGQVNTSPVDQDLRALFTAERRDDQVSTSPAEQDRLLLGKQRAPFFRMPLRSLFYYAAAFFLLAGATVFYFLKESADKTVLETYKTAEGEWRRLLLPDSSLAWINAMSAVTYSPKPAADKTVVEVSGEVYFEVKQNRSRVFEVKAGDVYLRVLGTRFLVSAYEEEQGVCIRVMEGSVQVQRGKSMRVLKPGEQVLLPDPTLSVATTDKTGKEWLVTGFDEKEVLAWKEGSFRFNSTELPVVLRRLGRWYGFEPEYPSGIPHKQISGKVQQDLSLSGLVVVLTTMKINCRLAGKKLIVTPD